MERETAIDFQKALIETLARERKARNMTYEQLASSAGLTRPAVSMIEAGKRNPTMHHVYKMVKAMDMTLIDFVASMGID